MPVTMKILILEDSDFDTIKIRKCVEKEPDMVIVASTNKEEEALTAVLDYVPHVIILDLELHNGVGDGISFLKKLNHQLLSMRPFVLVTTHNSSYIVHSQIRKLGGDFIMSKMQTNYSAEVVVGFLKDMKDVIFSEIMQPARTDQTEPDTSIDSPVQVTKRLMNRINAEFDLIEMSHKLSGRRYLIETMALILEKGMTENEAVKVVSKNNGKTDIATIQAMSNAIKKTWIKTDDESLYKYYTGHVRAETGVPTVTEFIYYYVDKISYS